MGWLKEFYKKYEFRRKTVHFVLGLFLVFFINLQFLTKPILLLLLSSAFIITFGLSVYTKFKKPKSIISFLSLFDKPKDLKKFPARGAVFYLVGVIVVLTLFERHVASASILILAVGDPISHIVGRYHGKTRIIVNKNKLLEGTLAGIFFGTVAASFFVPVPIAFFGAAFGMIAEAFELEVIKLDDNFFIPLVSASVMSSLIFLL